MKTAFVNKVVIVTGAGRGIGKHLALGFAKAGARAVIISRTLSGLRKTAREIKLLQKDVLVIKADISREKDVKRAVKIIGKVHKKVDILINNAGILGPLAKFTDCKPDEWINTVKINLLGTYLCTRYILPLMMYNKRGKIINLSGGGAAYPKELFSSYAVSKAGVLRLTDCLAEELKAYNIQVNAIAPGGVGTQMQKEISNCSFLSKDTLREAHEILSGGGTPPSKVVALALFLAGEDSHGLTGKLIHVNDGWQEWSAKDISRINDSDIYALRRINPKNENKDWFQG